MNRLQKKDSVVFLLQTEFSLVRAIIAACMFAHLLLFVRFISCDMLCHVIPDVVAGDWIVVLVAALRQNVLSLEKWSFFMQQFTLVKIKIVHYQQPAWSLWWFSEFLFIFCMWWVMNCSGRGIKLPLPENDPDEYYEDIRFFPFFRKTFPIWILTYRLHTPSSHPFLPGKDFYWPIRSTDIQHHMLSLIIPPLLILSAGHLIVFVLQIIRTNVRPVK